MQIVSNTGCVYDPTFVTRSSVTELHPFYGRARPVLFTRPSRTAVRLFLAPNWGLSHLLLLHGADTAVGLPWLRYGHRQQIPREHTHARAGTNASIHIQVTYSYVICERAERADRLKIETWSYVGGPACTLTCDSIMDSVRSQHGLEARWWDGIHRTLPAAMLCGEWNLLAFIVGSFRSVRWARLAFRDIRVILNLIVVVECGFKARFFVWNETKKREFIKVIWTTQWKRTEITRPGVCFDLPGGAGSCSLWACFQRIWSPGRSSFLSCQTCIDVKRVRGSQQAPRTML